MTADVRPLVTLAIIRFGDRWRLISDLREWGRFDYQVDAEEAALRLDARLTAAGEIVEILRQNAQGELRPLKRETRLTH